MSQRIAALFNCDFCATQGESQVSEHTHEVFLPREWHSIDIDRDPAKGSRLHVCPTHGDLTLGEIVEKLDERQRRERGIPEVTYGAPGRRGLR